MVAELNRLLPNDRNKRMVIERAFEADPQTADFVRDAISHVQEIWPEANVELQSIQYDDWDPPVSIVIYSNLRDSEFVDFSRTVSEWAVHQDGYNPDGAMILVHMK